VDTKNSKYKIKDEVSFEKRKLFGSSLIRGIIISSRLINYNWVYLVECCDDKKLIVVPEDDIWLLENNET